MFEVDTLIRRKEEDQDESQLNHSQFWNKINISCTQGDDCTDEESVSELAGPGRNTHTFT